MPKKIYIEKDKIARRAKKGYIGVKDWVYNDYIPVEYIESSKTQWIDTGYYVKYGDVVTIDMAFIDTQSYFGYYKANTDRFGLGVAKGAYEMVNGINSSIWKPTSDTERHTFVIDTTGQMKLDDTVQAVTAMPMDFVPTYSFALFGRKQSETSTSYRGQHRVYRFTVENNGNIIMNLLPCKRISDNVLGLINTVNGDFLINQGTGVFKSGEEKAASVAKVIKRAYIGIDGIARQFFNNEPTVKYYGTTTKLYLERMGIASGSIGNYVLFAGGTSGGLYVDTYNNLLIKGRATELSVGRTGINSATLSDYVLFAGGKTISDSEYPTIVETYDSTLVKGVASDLSVGRIRAASANVGGYALFAGGFKTGTSTMNVVDTYSQTLVKGLATELSESKDMVGGASVGDYALFAGGVTSSYSATVDTYNSALVKGTATSLSVERPMPVGISFIDYALFAGGGYPTSNSPFATVDTYNSALVKGTTSDLTVGKMLFSAVVKDKYALLGGGYAANYVATDTVDIYTKTLVKDTPQKLSVARYSLGGGAVGDYVLFAGGIAGTERKDTVDVFEVS